MKGITALLGATALVAATPAAAQQIPLSFLTFYGINNTSGGPNISNLQFNFSLFADPNAAGTDLALNSFTSTVPLPGISDATNLRFRTQPGVPSDSGLGNFTRVTIYSVDAPTLLNFGFLIDSSGRPPRISVYTDLGGSLTLNGFRYGLEGGFPIATAFPVASAVPEPAAWAMMIGGFGMIGGVMRRRRNVQLSFAAA